MSSTTESSDWNRSPPPLPSQDEQPPSPHHQSSSSALTTPRAGSYASITAQLESQLGLTAPTASNTTTGTTSASVSASKVLPSQHAGYATQLQDTPEWEAARASVLNRMVTSEGLTSSTPTIAANLRRGGVKTGGRRGRGGRRPVVKIEPGLEGEGTSLEAANAAGVRVETIPARGKNKGGRPRGSRKATDPARGGRPSQAEASASASASGASPASARGSATRGRGGRPRGSRAGSSTAGLLQHIVKKKKKRKRKDDDSENSDDTDASEEFTLSEITSSGRRVVQAKTFSPLAPSSATKPPSAKKTPLNASHASKPAARASTPPSLRAPKKRRKPGEAAVCINCGRGHSPLSNQIVFCDGCNTPWHQFCHDRPITPSFIQDETKEWICMECENVKRERAHLVGRVSAESGMTEAEKREYFRGMEKDELVSLLMHASALYPALPIFRPPPSAPPAKAQVPTIIVEPTPVRMTSTTTTGANNTVQAVSAATAAGTEDVAEEAAEEDFYATYVPADPLPYPKAGNGIVLPPEEDDLELLIDEDVVSYSHSWKERLGLGWAGAMGGGVGRGSGGLGQGGGGDGGGGGMVIDVGA